MPDTKFSDTLALTAEVVPVKYTVVAVEVLDCTLVAFDASETAPLTLPPGILVNPEPIPEMIPVVFSVPVTFTPVPVTTRTLATPATLILTFPLASTDTLLLPLAMNDGVIHAVFPVPFVCST